MNIRKPIFHLLRTIIRHPWMTWAIRLPPVLRVSEFVYEHLGSRKPVIIGVEGRKIYVDPTDIAFSLNLGLPERSYKWFWRDLCLKEVKSGMTVLDLGAHIGYFTLLFSELVGEKGKVFAFEPDPYNYDLLTKNISLNGCGNVVAVQKAVSDKAGQIKLFLNKHTSRNHSLYGSREMQKYIMIDAVTLDEYMAGMPVHFIKMNIEGAELAAIQGASRIIEENKNLKLLIEAHVKGLSRSGSSVPEFLEKLAKYGFKFYSIYEKEKSAEASSVDALMEEYAGKKFMHLFCVRE